jgi:hypothetical protein
MTRSRQTLCSTLHYSTKTSSSQMFCNISSQTSTVHPPTSSELLGDNLNPTKSQSEASSTLPSGMSRSHPLPIHSANLDPATLHHSSGTARPTAYAPHLMPIPSPLRPHCLARDHLCLWKPAPHQAGLPSDERNTFLSDQDLSRIFEVTSFAWAESTQEAYSSGILAYHIHCDKRSILEYLRAPTSHPLVASFVASLAGSYSGSTISNYIHGVRAWHILHGLPLIGWSYL